MNKPRVLQTDLNSLLVALNAHIVLVPTGAVVKSLANGSDLVRIEIYDCIQAALLPMVDVTTTATAHRPRRKRATTA